MALFLFRVLDEVEARLIWFARLREYYARGRTSLADSPRFASRRFVSVARGLGIGGSHTLVWGSWPRRRRSGSRLGWVQPAQCRSQLVLEAGVSKVGVRA